MLNCIFVISEQVFKNFIAWGQKFVHIYLSNHNVLLTIIDLYKKAEGIQVLRLPFLRLYYLHCLFQYLSFVVA